MSEPEPLLLSRRFWQPLGYALSAAWMIGILVLTNGNSRHPYFDYIFIVPLIGWAIGIALAFAIRKARGK